jgi:hypothetical protein
VLNKPEKLLKESGRFVDIIVGYICAAISIAVAALLVWLVYLVIWRNPREYGVHDAFQTSTIIIFSFLLIIAVGFSVLAFRLIASKRKHKTLLSPMLLRIWGVFFFGASLVMLITCYVNKRWGDILNVWEIVAGSVSIAIAAFAFASKKEQEQKKNIQPLESINTPPDLK